jgi:hypothetical protein
VLAENVAQVFQPAPVSEANSFLPTKIMAIETRAGWKTGSTFLIMIEARQTNSYAARFNQRFGNRSIELN